MIAATIWNQLVATLKVDSLNYMEYVYEGRRFDVEPESLPCLMLEPSQDGEPQRRTANVDLQVFTVDIYGVSSNNFDEHNKIIVGDQNYKGVLDVAQDVKAVLKASSTLGDIVYDVNIQPVIFDVIDVEKYPVRGFLMPVQITYRQTDGI